MITICCCFKRPERAILVCGCLGLFFLLSHGEENRDVQHGMVSLLSGIFFSFGALNIFLDLYLHNNLRFLLMG